MKKVYQRITNSPSHGDCMQAAFASLFEDRYEDVPAFIEIENMAKAFDDYIESKGYILEKVLHNKTWEILYDPTYECTHNIDYNPKEDINPSDLSEGVNGYFYCIVLSPGHFFWDKMETHAVICDRNLNIVHDPNKEYKDIKQYPLTSILGCNGIIAIYDIRKK